MVHIKYMHEYADETYDLYGAIYIKMYTVCAKVQSLNMRVYEYVQAKFLNFSIR